MYRKFNNKKTYKYNIKFKNHKILDLPKID